MRSIKFYPSVLIIWILTLIFIDVSGQNLSGLTRNTTSLSNYDVTKSSRYLLQKAYRCKEEIQRYTQYNRALQFFPTDDIIYNTNDVILAKKETALRKFIFLGLYYDSQKKIKEARYFYKDDFEKIRFDYFFQREKIIRRFGQPISSENLSYLSKTIWRFNKLTLEFWMEKKIVNKEGAIFLSIKPEKVKKENIIPKIEKELLDSLQTNKLMEVAESPGLEEMKTSKSPILKRTSLKVSRATSLRVDGFDGAEIITRITTNDNLELLDNESNFFYSKVRVNALEGWVNKSLLFSKEL